MYSDERTVLMPILARGGHSHPRYGACLTEVAAVLTTHRWTDHPGCVPACSAGPPDASTT
jgi:hypothetical protein